MIVTSAKKKDSEYQNDAFEESLFARAELG